VGQQRLWIYPASWLQVDGVFGFDGLTFQHLEQHALDGLLVQQAVAVSAGLAFLQVRVVQVLANEAPALAVAGNPPHAVQFRQIERLLVAAVGPIQAEPPGASNVFRFQEAHQLGCLAMAAVDVMGAEFAHARRAASVDQFHAADGGEVAAARAVKGGLRQLVAVFRDALREAGGSTAHEHGSASTIDLDRGL